VRPSGPHRMNDPSPFVVGHDADFDEVSGRVGSEEERDLLVVFVDADPMAEGMTNVVVIDSVAASAGCDRRFRWIHFVKTT
jgi:hypothetical protein